MPEKTRRILSKYDIHLDKNKSQNYLISRNKLDKIICEASIRDDETILEIGAGIGTLTLELAKHAKKVVTIEKDVKIVEILRKRIIEERITNVEVINSDALKIDYPSFDKVVSNLPYQISSPVTFKLLDYDFELAVLMYQYEFAQRMMASPGTKNYSRLSVALYYKAEVELVDTLKPSCFIPQPKVDSAVVKLHPKTKPVLPGNFDEVLKALFQHKNQKARKALINSAHELRKDKKTMKNTLQDMEDPLYDKKVFMLTPEEITRIATSLEQVL